MFIVENYAETEYLCFFTHFSAETGQFEEAPLTLTLTLGGQRIETVNICPVYIYKGDSSIPTTFPGLKKIPTSVKALMI